MGSLIAFGTAAIYVAFLMVALAALIARRSRYLDAGGRVTLGRAGTVVNALAVGWLAFESVNIAWPRTSLAPPGAPFYQVWAAPIVLAIIALAGVAYLVLARRTCGRRRPGLSGGVGAGSPATGSGRGRGGTRRGSCRRGCRSA